MEPRLRGGLRALLALLVPVLAAAAASAQLSPGPLSAPHEFLEGSSQCLKCHSAGRGVDPDACLSCHQILRRRVSAGEGLHASPGYADCKTCHIDHQGREFELVWWGEAGRAAFDHDLTGWSLLGAHSALECRQCHEPGKIGETQALEAQGKDLSRTFLGLNGDRCTACHEDPHGGSVGDRCESCHTVEAWRPAAAFDHSTTSFPLTGLHATVGCVECHRAATGASPSFSVEGRDCRDCHRDPHDDRFGRTCADCHGTSGWRRVTLTGFDHDRTRYPLRGRHRDVACEGCHRPGAPRRGLSFGACSDCHRDPHEGQFRDREDGGRCESCHDVRGFVPSSFGMARHRESSFPLTGAHQAVPCVACHQERLAALPPAGRGGRFDFPDQRCRTCHGDPHRGEADLVVEAEGCTGCHEVGSWLRVSFDHSRTAFRLEGRHATIDCRSCHPTVEADGPGETIRMRGLSAACSACHADPHAGQFADTSGATDCRRCHDVEQWPRTSFDHDRDAAFPLRGAHESVPCESCHRILRDETGREHLQFRPLPTACADCHAD